jgi:hypothetical protein
LLPGTSQPIGKRVSGRLNGTSVAAEFKLKQNSELSDNRGRRPHDAVRLEIGEQQVHGPETGDTRIHARTGIAADGPW